MGAAKKAEQKDKKKMAKKASDEKVKALEKEIKKQKSVEKALKNTVNTTSELVKERTKAQVEAQAASNLKAEHVKRAQTEDEKAHKEASLAATKALKAAKAVKAHQAKFDKEIAKAKAAMGKAQSAGDWEAYKAAVVDVEKAKHKRNEVSENSKLMNKQANKADATAKEAKRKLVKLQGTGGAPASNQTLLLLDLH